MLDGEVTCVDDGEVTCVDDGEVTCVDDGEVTCVDDGEVTCVDIQVFDPKRFRGDNRTSPLTTGVCVCIYGK